MNLFKFTLIILLALIFAFSVGAQEKTIQKNQVPSAVLD
jgi:hypothetical protein